MTDVLTNSPLNGLKTSIAQDFDTHSVHSVYIHSVCMTSETKVN